MNAAGVGVHFGSIRGSGKKEISQQVIGLMIMLYVLELSYGAVRTENLS